MNVDIQEEKARVAIEVEELKLRILKIKEDQQKLILDLTKKVGQ